ncbi:uncharacterized protein LOC102151209 isoform X4 [Canis lupus familiaris]|uniref:uncharacterized protein LOC102151209 isoform X4 n=1 Tax=Canis lupus familiaris TaxID=9615 RepID=UPI0018F5B1A1|nr:uncharacterized protein LOC102151209 isoform X4 [Canis lupus familiaris]
MRAAAPRVRGRLELGARDGQQAQVTGSRRRRTSEQPHRVREAASRPARAGRGAGARAAVSGCGSPADQPSVGSAGATFCGRRPAVPRAERPLPRQRLPPPRPACVRACVRAAGSPARLASVGSEPEAPRESRAAAGRVRPGRGGGRGRLAVTPPQALAVAPFSSPPPLLRSLSGLRHLCAVGPGGLRRPLSGSGVAFQCGMKFAGVSPKDLNLYLELIKILSSGKCPQSSCQWLRDD